MTETRSTYCRWVMRVTLGWKSSHPQIKNRPTKMPMTALQHRERRIHLPHLPHLSTSLSFPMSLCFPPSVLRLRMGPFQQAMGQKSTNSSSCTLRKLFSCDKTLRLILLWISISVQWLWASYPLLRWQSPSWNWCGPRMVMLCRNWRYLVYERKLWKRGPRMWMHAKMRERRDVGRRREEELA
jgi:hypothetical protein